MTQRYSLRTLLGHALGRHLGWEPAWRTPQPRKSYDAVIIGGGPHGLATAYYLARNHGLRRVAVLEQSGIGGVPLAPESPILCPQPLLLRNAAFHAYALALWRGLSQELEFNVMASARGHLQAACAPRALDALVLRGNLLRLHGVPAEILSRTELHRAAPMLDYTDGARFPLCGALLEPAASAANPQAVAWAYARAADRLGVDILQGCAVHDYLRADGGVTGVRTSLGDIAAGKVALALPSRATPLADRAGIVLPGVQWHWCIAVTEAVRPMMPHTMGWSAGDCHVSQPVTGEMIARLHAGPGAGDQWALARHAPATTTQMQQLLQQQLASLLPFASRLRLLRTAAGAAEACPDALPCLGSTPIPGLYVDVAWSDGGFHATPAAGWCLAHALATGQPHGLARAFDPHRILTPRDPGAACANTPQEAADAAR